MSIGLEFAARAHSSEAGSTPEGFFGGSQSFPLTDGWSYSVIPSFFDFYPYVSDGDAPRRGGVIFK